MRLSLSMIPRVVNQRKQSDDAGTSAHARPAANPPDALEDEVLSTEQLFAGRQEIRLLHRGQEYRLRITRLGKLILTK